MSVKRWIDLKKSNTSASITVAPRAFPFHDAGPRVSSSKHDVVYVVEQNRDAQLRTLLINRPRRGSDKTGVRCCTTTACQSTPGSLSMRCSRRK